MLQQGRQGRRIAATKIKEGKRPAGEMSAKRDVKLRPDFSMKHVIASNHLLIGGPGVEKKFTGLFGHRDTSLSAEPWASHLRLLPLEKSKCQ